MIPLLEEKFDYLCDRLGINQKSIALDLGIHTSFISHWKRNNSIPKSRIGPLCKILGGISLDIFKSPSMEVFVVAVEKHFNTNVGSHWRAYAQQHAHGGLDFDVINSNVGRSSGLKGIYKTPQPCRFPNAWKRVTINEAIRFKLGVTQAKVANDDPKMSC